MEFCKSSLSETACKEDGSCTRINGNSWHPFSILVNGEYLPSTVENCAKTNGSMEPEPYLTTYKDQCGLMPNVLFGNTSFGARYDPANSSPDRNFGIFKDCWKCIKEEENLENIKESLAKCLDLNESKLTKYMEQSTNVINKKVKEKRSGNVTLTRQTDDVNTCLDTENIEDCI